MRFLPNAQRTDRPATLTADVCSTLVPAGAHALACRPHKPALQQSVANRSSAAQPSDRDSRQPRRGCNAPLTALRRARKFVSWRVTFLTDEIDRRHGGRSNVGMSLRSILLRHRKAVSNNRYSAQNDCFEYSTFRTVADPFSFHTRIVSKVLISFVKQYGLIVIGISARQKIFLRQSIQIKTEECAEPRRSAW